MVKTLTVRSKEMTMRKQAAAFAMLPILAFCLCLGCGKKDNGVVRREGEPD
jgi:hypothetical protein